MNANSSIRSGIPAPGSKISRLRMPTAIKKKSNEENIPMDFESHSSTVKRSGSPESSAPVNKKPKMPAVNVGKLKSVRKVMSTNQKRARRSVQLAHQVQRSLVAKGNVNKTITVPVTRKPLVSTTNKPLSTRTKQPIVNRNSRPKPAPLTTASKSTPPSGSTVAKPKKAPKRPAWDIKGQLSDLNEKFEVLQAQFMQSKEEATAAEQGKVLIKGEFEGKVYELEKEISMYKEKLFEKERKVDQLQSTLDQEKQIFERTMMANKSEWEMEKRNLNTDNQIWKNKFEEFKIKNEELQHKLSVCEQKCANLDAAYKKCKEDIILHHEERKKLLNEVQELKGNIRVFVRSRPLLAKEDEEAEINYNNDGKSMHLTKDGKPVPFKFDKVFGPTSTQAEVFEELSLLTQSALDGYNICVFAYGQTGSGKTHTMEGPPNCSEKDMGVIQRTMIKLFDAQKSLHDLGWSYEFKVQQVEIYKENLRDLLKDEDNKNDKLSIKTVGNNGRIWVENLSEHNVSSISDVMRLLSVSRKRRATASTLANDRSSRSHSVFILKIFATNKNTNTTMESWLNLVDLAGSERIADTGAEGQRMTEAKAINKSLQHLSKVIMEISSKSSHVSYRGSKLTFLLKDCIGGNSKTLMLVNINPSMRAVSESVRTLTFASTVNQCNIGTAQKVVKM